MSRAFTLTEGLSGRPLRSMRIFPLLSICSLQIPKWKVSCRELDIAQAGTHKWEVSDCKFLGNVFAYEPAWWVWCETSAFGFLNSLSCSWNYPAFSNSDNEGLTSTLALRLPQYRFTPHEWILNLKNNPNGSFMHFTKQFFLLNV